MVDTVFLVGILGLACLLVVVGGGVALAVVLLTQRRREVPVGRARPRRDDSDVGVARPGRTVRPAPSTAPRFCPECDTALPPDAPEGLCPRCLLRGVIGSAHDAAKAAPAQQTAAYAGSSTAPAVEELAPLFPQLEIIELLGQGGMGAVYKARQPSLDRLVAVKVLPQEAGRDPAFAERFSREARALARLSHPNVVAVHDVGKTGDFYYFVMEYVDGVNLRQVLRDGQLRPEQALQIVPQICDALQYAHEEGVVHRDVKPENILLDRKGRVKIADFGLAKLLGRDAGDFTLTGSRQVMGTLYYMAPEQVERPLEVDHRADVYSLGVVFYEMLTGELPLGRFAPPSQKAQVDVRLDEIVLRALEKEPQRRYQQVSEFGMAIQTLGNEAGSPIHDGSETKTAIDASGRGSQPHATTSMFSTGQSLEEGKQAQGQREAAVIRAGGYVGSILGGIIGAIIGFIYGMGAVGAGGFSVTFGLVGAVGGLLLGRLLAGFYVGYVTAKTKYHPRKADAKAKEEGRSPNN